MKHTKILVLMLLLISSVSLGFTAPAHGQAASTPISLSINDTFVSPQPTLLIKNTLYIPLRSLSALQLSYDWNAAKQQVTVKNGASVLTLTIGSKTAFKNKVPLQLSTPPVLRSGRTYVPLRFVSQTLDSQVRWFEGSKQASILTNAFIAQQQQSLTKLMDPNGNRDELDQKVGESFHTWGQLLALNSALKEPISDFDLYHIWFDPSDPTRLTLHIINRGLSGDVEPYSKAWLGTKPLYNLIIQLQIKDNKVTTTWMGQLTNKKNLIQQPFNKNDNLDAQLVKIMGSHYGYTAVAGKKMIIDHSLRAYKGSSIGGLAPLILPAS
ncbi:hypothetical protein J2Z69_002586 [Paenibacillus shirakamiensis]|uniref:Copper amine oxidase-like N-terminal domain-containing protein n=1 Tax=Paenibacillus shirakamiensis TaxID=1265935 RepID=A0ABS4JKB3_9BACL|nr:copper amine oxidase N-terminal domain-containing protein [Paenibacillus shirakamiensis]MBP2001541.1 hypothetical protein [Paenibacillus shirakamiensis]